MQTYNLEEIKELRILGRHGEETNPVTLFWHGSGIELTLKARELWVECYTEYEYFEQWISIWIDGALISRQIVVNGKSWIPVFLNADPWAVHHVKILKEVQPMTEDRINLFQICRVKTDGQFLNNPKPSMKLEFIGDSITSGEGTIGAISEMNWNSMVMGASFAYPLLTANALQAEARMMSKGGWGVYCSYDKIREKNIPAYYGEVASFFAGRKEEDYGACEKNDFDAWKPDVIIVNLGTNDSSAYGNTPEEEKPAFVEAVKKAATDFLYTLREKNPDAHIIWAYGSFPETLTLEIKDALEAYVEKTGDQKAEAVKFPTLTDELKGSREHPGRKWHEMTTELLVQKIKNMFV